MVRWLGLGVVLGLVWGCSGGGSSPSPRVTDGDVEPGPVEPAPPPPVAVVPPAPEGADAGVDLNALPVQEKGSSGWKTVSGSPAKTTGIGVDEGGNVWVSAGTDGLFVRRSGESAFAHHPTTQSALTVTGGASGVAYVGYQGQAECASEFHKVDNDPTYVPNPTVYKSGDADRVELTASGLAVSHYDISSPAGAIADYPRGREKLCTVYRIAYDARTRSVWFGANHGVAWGDADSTAIEEHTHPAINGYSGYGPDGVPTGYTLYSGDYWGVAVDSAGDLWLGGTERSAKFPWASLNRDFWKADGVIQQTKIDVWPDKKPVDPAKDDQIPDKVSGFAPTADGSVFAGSFEHGLAFIGADGKLKAHYTQPLINKNIRVVKVDPADGSVWLGHATGGITRLTQNAWWHYGAQALGRMAGSRVMDIAFDTRGDSRKVYVAFSSGVMMFEGL